MPLTQGVRGPPGEPLRYGVPPVQVAAALALGADGAALGTRLVATRESLFSLEKKARTPPCPPAARVLADRHFAGPSCSTVTQLNAAAEGQHARLSLASCRPCAWHRACQ